MKTNNLQDLAVLNQQSIARTEHQKMILSGTSLTPKQEELYKRLIHGLSLYTPEELYNMNSAKKKRIAKAHAKATQILNVYKQEIINAKLQSAIGLVDSLLPTTGTVKSTIVTICKRYEDRNIMRKNTRKEAPSEAMPALFKMLMQEEIEPDPHFSPSVTFRQLDVTKQMIIKKLLECRLLPSNFDTL
jgi:hypothetical protein